MKPFFTIITVCFNSEKTLSRTIESVNKQKFDNYEYLIIDGASTDNSLSIIKKYMNLNNRINVYSEPDTGIYNAMNKGIKYARGEWIIFINSDDWLRENVLEIVEQSILKHKELDYLYGDVYKVSNYNGSSYGKYEKAEEDLSFIRKGMIFSHQSLFVKRKVFNEIGQFDETLNIAADWDFICRLYKRNLKWAYIPVCISNFTVGGACSKPHPIQRYKVRKKNNLVGVVDKYLLREIIYILKNNLISSFNRQYKDQKVLKGFQLLNRESNNENQI